MMTESKFVAVEVPLHLEKANANTNYVLGSISLLKVNIKLDYQ